MFKLPLDRYYFDNNWKTALPETIPYEVRADGKAYHPFSKIPLTVIYNQLTDILTVSSQTSNNRFRGNRRSVYEFMVALNIVKQ